MTNFVSRVRASEPALGRCAAIAIAACAAMFLLQGRIGINLQDEAFLWYGAIRTHAGELPLRDFRSYDPGRYVWCAAWASAFGDGLVALRAAGWAFAAIGLTAGLAVVSRATRHVALLAVAAFVLVAWMSPPWKLYESSVAMTIAWLVVRLVESPSRARVVAAGVGVGLAAFFGRNMGVYAGVGAFAATVYACWTSRAPLVRSIGALIAGTVVGYAPMIALVAFASGYREAFVDSIAFYARQGALNAELPFPFPWRPESERQPYAGSENALVEPLFLAVPIAYVALIAYALLARRGRVDDDAHGVRPATFVALACVGAAWFHHATVRSDLPHLAQSIHPFLLAMLVLPSAFAPTRRTLARAVTWTALVVVTAFAIGPSSPLVRRISAPPDAPFTPVLVGADELMLSRNDAALVRGLTSTIERHVRPDDELWVAAQYVALYPMLGRRAPTWDVYPAWQADEREQDRMLRELASVRWALIDTRAIGGDARMRLELTHPRVWSLLVDAFERVPVSGLPPTALFLRRKG